MTGFDSKRQAAMDKLIEIQEKLGMYDDQKQGVLMKEEWLFRGALVPIDAATTAALVAEIKRLIDVVGGLVLQQGPDYERGFVDGMSKQAQSSVDKAVNAMAQPEPVAWLELLREAKDNCKASIVEEGISASRKEYRIELEARLTAALNASPPKRPWVGLTAQEAADCWTTSATKTWHNFEAKLKEKNT